MHSTQHSLAEALAVAAVGHHWSAIKELAKEIDHANWNSISKTGSSLFEISTRHQQHYSALDLLNQKLDRSVFSVATDEYNKHGDLEALEILNLILSLRKKRSLPQEY